MGAFVGLAFVFRTVEIALRVEEKLVREVEIGLRLRGRGAAGTTAEAEPGVAFPGMVRLCPTPGSGPGHRAVRTQTRSPGEMFYSGTVRPPRNP